MNIITISREFGSGGRELGKRLADHLGYDYYDRQIITSIAENKGLDADYIESALENHAWQNVVLTYRHSFSLSAPSTIQTDLLLEQKKVIEQIARLGNDCIIVGRNADILLKEYQPLSLYVCASMEAKIRRCMERAEDAEKYTSKQMEQTIKRIDKSRKTTRRILSGSEWGHPLSYDLTVNTTGKDLKSLSFAVADFAASYFRRK